MPYFVTMHAYAAINSSLIQLIVSHICTFKNNYTPSSYLGLTSKLSESKELVKFRIGNHKLRIETGRYDQIPRVKRLCPISVSNQIEDESHFLIYCNQYSILRNKFYKKNKTYHSDFETIIFVTSHWRAYDFFKSLY